jgi:hypothetical protein
MLSLNDITFYIFKDLMLVIKLNFADGREGLQIWRVAANSMLNKQSRITDKVWSSSFGVGRRANNLPPHKNSMLGNVTDDLGFVINYYQLLNDCSMRLVTK